MFKHNFDLKNATHIKRNNNLLIRKFLESAAIDSSQDVNLSHDFFQISPFLKETNFPKTNIHDHNSYKNKRKQSTQHHLLLKINTYINNLFNKNKIIITLKQIDICNPIRKCNSTPSSAAFTHFPLLNYINKLSA